MSLSRFGCEHPVKEQVEQDGGPLVAREFAQELGHLRCAEIVRIVVAEPWPKVTHVEFGAQRRTEPVGWRVVVSPEAPAAPYGLMSIKVCMLGGSSPGRGLRQF